MRKIKHKLGLLQNHFKKCIAISVFISLRKLLVPYVIKVGRINSMCFYI